MKTQENYRGARHRTLMLLYTVWITLSLAPAMVAPPERSFQRGQPEMQQSMDNMVVHQALIQKRAGVSAKDEDQEISPMNYLKEVNIKTSKLLAEAKKVLKTLPDSKERQWMESFVEKMQEISKMLKTTAQHKIMAKDRESKKDSPVPNGLPKQSEQPATSAVPEINPFQRPISRISKIQMTSPEISRVLPKDDQPEHQAVTKPVAVSSKEEEYESDELVRELESLHNEGAHQTVSEDSKLDQAQTTTPPPTPSTTKNSYATLVREEIEKAKREESSLIKEIEEFHRQGGVLPKEILAMLYADSHKVTGSVENRKINTGDEMKFTEAGMRDRRGMMRVDDLGKEDREISMTSMKTMGPYAAQQFQYMKNHREFPYKQPVAGVVQGVPGQPGHYYQNIRAQPYQSRPQNLEQNLQKINPYHQGKYQDLALMNQQGYNPAVIKQRFPKPQYYYNGRLPPYGYPNDFMRPSYAPYPYMPTWNLQNSSVHVPQMMPPSANNQAKISTQLSDEMKRELRDGKIIVLSDSVVRSNFEPTEGTQSTTENPESEHKKVDMKNETITEK